MPRGRPMPPLILVAEERATLERWSRRPKTAQALAQRARIVLACAAETPNGAVAARERVTRQTVGRWRARFLSQRLDGLLDEPRPGAPRRITDSDVEHVLTLTLEHMPADATHWSSRALARKCGLSQSAVSRIWRAFALQPHRVEPFQLSRDPLFIEKVRDIVGLYLHPPDKAVVLSVDEKTQIQALDRSQPLLPMRPGQVERRTHDYVRHGTTALFAALNVKSGAVLGQCHRRHRPGGADSLRPPSHPGQLRDAQNAPHPSLVGPPSPLPSAFHADWRHLDQLGRTLVRPADRKTNSSWRAPQHSGARRRHCPIHSGPQRTAQTLRVDQNR